MTILHFSSASRSGEARLCRLNAGFESPAGYVGETVGGAAKYLADMGIDTASDFGKGLIEAWKLPGLEEKAKRELFHESARFMRDAPVGIKKLFGQFVAPQMKNLKLEELKVFMSHEEWLKAFKKIDLEAAYQTNGLPDLKEGPIEILKRVQLHERKTLFADYIRNIIPDTGSQEELYGENKLFPLARERIMLSLMQPNSTLIKIKFNSQIVALQKAKNWTENKALEQIQKNIEGLPLKQFISLFRSEVDAVVKAIKDENAPAHQHAIREEKERQEKMPQTVANKWKNAINSSQLALGLNDAAAAGVVTGVQKSIAQDSLKARYLEPGLKVDADGVITFDAEAGGNANLTRNFRDGNRAQPGAGTAAELAAKLHGPSFLKGALKEGVIKGTMFDELQRGDAKDRQNDLQKLEQVNADLRRLSGVVDRAAEKEAKEEEGYMLNMTGTEKLALGAILVAAYYFGGNRVRGVLTTAGIGLTGAYFIQRMNGDQNPVKSWQGWFRKGMNAMGVTKYVNAVSAKPQVIPAEMEARADIVSRFMSEKARERITNSVTGMVLLNDMPLADLARNFTISKGAKTGFLDVTNQNFRDSTERSMNRVGLEPDAVDKFFTENRGVAEVEYKKNGKDVKQKVPLQLEEVGSALSTVCFLVARRYAKPQYAQDLQYVQMALDKSPDGTYDHMPDTINVPQANGAIKEVNVREKFEHLAREGQAIALGMNMRLGDFIVDELGIPKDITQSDVKNEHQIRAQAKNAELQNVEFDVNGTKYFISVSATNEKATVGMYPKRWNADPRRVIDTMRYPVEFNVADVASWDTNTIQEKWFEKAVEQKLKNELSTPPGSLGKFNAKAEGKLVKYGTDLARPKVIAEDSVPEFLVTDAATIFGKYKIWATDAQAAASASRPFPNRSALNY